MITFRHRGNRSYQLMWSVNFLRSVRELLHFRPYMSICLDIRTILRSQGNAHRSMNSRMDSNLYLNWRVCRESRPEHRNTRQLDYLLGDRNVSFALKGSQDSCFHGRLGRSCNVSSLLSYRKLLSNYVYSQGRRRVNNSLVCQSVSHLQGLVPSRLRSLHRLHSLLIGLL